MSFARALMAVVFAFDSSYVWIDVTCACAYSLRSSTARLVPRSANFGCSPLANKILAYFSKIFLKNQRLDYGAGIAAAPKSKKPPIQARAKMMITKPTNFHHK